MNRNGADVIGIHVERGDAGIAGSHDLYGGIRCAHVKLQGDFIQRHAAPLTIAGHEQAVGAAAPPEILLHLFMDTVPEVCVGQPLEHGFPGIGHGPAGDQGAVESRTRGAVGVLIGGHNHTALAGGGNESDNVATLAPDIYAERLQVRDVYRQSGFFSNPDSFACGT